MKNYRCRFLRYLFCTIILLTTPHFSLFAAQATAPVEQQDISIDDFDFNFNPDELIPDEAYTAPTAAQQDLDIHIPFLGNRKLVSFVDEQTHEDGYMVRVTDKAQLPAIGNLTIEDLEIRFVKNVWSITGHLSLLGKKGQFSATNIVFSDQEILIGKSLIHVKNNVKKLTLACTFVHKPTLVVGARKKITLDTITLSLERGKPAIVKAATTMVNRPVIIGLAFTKKTLSAFINLPHDTPLETIAPEVASTPLKNAIIQKAKLKINNIYAKKAPATPAEETDEEKEKRESEEEERQFNATLDGLIVIDSDDLIGASQTDPENVEPTVFSISGKLSGKGVTLNLQAANFPIKGIGTLDHAALVIDTMTPPSSMQLTGTLLLQFPGIENTTAAATIVITKGGIEVSGDIKKDISYAGIVLKGAHIGFDTETKKFNIAGTATIHDILFTIGLTIGRDPDEPTKKVTILSAKADIPEFAPFKTVPGLESLKFTNIKAGINIKKSGKETKPEFVLGGNVHLFGVNLTAAIHFVENENKEKGVYVTMPLVEGKTLGQAIPGLNVPPIGEIQLKEAMFQACSIDYVDPATDEKINKGLSLLAHVPLTGPLKKAASITGSKDQDLIMKGTLAMNNPKASEFSILLSRGDPDATKKFSLGEIAIALSGKPSFSVGAEVIYRPANQTPLEFKGTFDFSTDVTKPTPPTVTLTAQMQGKWDKAFGRTGWLVEDVALLIGMVVGSPGLPTEFGGTGRLKIKEYLDLKVAFMLSADVKKIGFEGETKEDISLANMIGLVGEIINKPLSAKGAPALAIKKDAIVKYATTSIKIGNKVITPGLIAKAQMDIFGAIANLDIFVGCDDPTNCGFKAYASLDPINIKNVLKITGYEDKETGVKLDKPKLDVEFTLQRQIFHLSGLLNIADIIQSKTLLEFSDQGVIFDFEESFGGDKLTWTDSTGKKTPLLYARVKGKSSGSLKDPDFTLNIVFKQYLKQYLVWVIRKKIEEAKKEVREGINKAQKEIDKIDGVIADMNKKIESARKDVKEAKSDYGRRIDDVRELQKKFDAAAKDTAAIDKKISDLKAWYNALPASNPSKELEHFFNVADTARYSLFNDTPFPAYVRFEFIGDYWRKDIAPQAWATVKSGLLHKGWSTVFIRAKVGQVWGKNPETGADLVFTDKMINSKGECYGIAPSIFKSSGQAINHKFRLTVVPKKNPKDNNNWWPSIDISRIHRDIILATKGSKAGEYAAKLAAFETQKFVVQTTMKGIRDTLNIATGTQKGFEGIIDVGDKFLKDVVQPGGKAVLQGSAIVSKGVLEGVKQTTLGIMDAGKEILTRPLELFDINEIYYNGSLHDLKDGVLGDVKIVGIIASQHFSFSVSIAPKKGFENLAKVLEGVAKKIGDEIKDKIFDPINKKLHHQSTVINKELAAVSTGTAPAAPAKK